jgi:hypothetical protein
MATLTITWTHNDDVLADFRVFLHDASGTEIPFTLMNGGRVEWTVPVGTTVTLDFDIWYGAAHTLHVQQRLHLVSAAPGVAFDGTDGPWTRHPRVRPGAVGAGSTSHVTLAIDTQFSDMTDTLPALHPSLDVPGQYEIRLLQQTVADMPRVWAVVVPHAFAATTTDVQVLVFFSPVGVPPRPQNQSVPGANHGTLQWYMGADPTPFAFTFHSSSGWLVRGRPRFDMAGQLSASGKAALLVFPYYSDALMGSFSERGGDGPRLMRTVRGILTALWSDQRVGNGAASGVRLAKLGIAGFSFGGGPALAAWNNLHAATTELTDLILFDPVPNPPIAGYASFEGDLSSWGSSAGKRYQLFRGGQFEPGRAYWTHLQAYNDAWATGAGPAPQELAVGGATNAMSSTTGLYFTDANKATIETVAFGAARQLDARDFAPIEASTFAGAFAGHGTFASIGGQPGGPFPIAGPPALGAAVFETNYQRIRKLLDHSARASFLATVLAKLHHHPPLPLTAEEHTIAPYFDQADPFNYRHQWALSGFEYVTSGGATTPTGHFQLAVQRSTFT